MKKVTAKEIEKRGGVRRPNSNCRVQIMTEWLEKEISMPEGSLRFHWPDGSPVRARTTLHRVRLEWAREG
jgi:hypothetical protein